MHGIGPRSTGLSTVISDVKQGRTIRPRTHTDSEGLIAVFCETKTDEIWYVERVKSIDGNSAYRAIVLRPHFTEGVSRNPIDHHRGEPLSNDFQSCEVLIFDLPAEEVADVDSGQQISARKNSLFAIGKQNLVERGNAHSDRELLNSYNRFFRSDSATSAGEKK